MTTTAPALIPLPLLCGPAGNLDRGGDMNITWTCKRAHQLYMLHVWTGNLAAEVARAEKLERKGLTRRAANLRRYIAEEADRQSRQVPLILDRLAPCAHAAADRREMTPAESLPGCSC